MNKYLTSIGINDKFVRLSNQFMIGSKFFLIPVLFFILTCSAQTQNVEYDFAIYRDLDKQGKMKESSDILNEMMVKYPDDIRVFREWTLINLYRYSSFDTMYKELSKIFPANNIALMGLTYILLNDRKYDEALKNAEKLTTVQPYSAAYWILKGEIFEAMKRNEEALSSFNKATSLDTTNSMALEHQARFLVKVSRYDEAIASYTRAIDLDSHRKSLYIYFRGSVYCRKGDKTNALDDLKKALSMTPSYKSRAVRDGFYKNLYEDEDFQKIVEY